MAREDPTVYMRLPADLKAKLDAAANEAHRSLTAEVVARLEASFKPNIRWTPAGGPERLKVKGAAEGMETMNFDELVEAVVERLKGTK